MPNTVIMVRGVVDDAALAVASKGPRTFWLEGNLGQVAVFQVLFRDDGFGKFRKGRPVPSQHLPPQSRVPCLQVLAMSEFNRRTRCATKMLATPFGGLINAHILAVWTDRRKAEGLVTQGSQVRQVRLGPAGHMCGTVSPS